MAWIRFVVASLLLAGYGVSEFLSRVTAWRQRPPRVRRPLWSHLLGFAAMIFFYGAIGTDGRAVMDGTGNSIGVAIAALAIVLRFTLRRRRPALGESDLVTRMLLFGALPLVVGSPLSVLALTLPQAVITAKEAHQRSVLRAASRAPEARGAR